MGIKIRDTDKGFKKRKEALEGGIGITIGIHEREGGEPHKTKDGKAAGETTVLDVAIWNEFGTDSIPARSFLRAPFDENSDKWHGWYKTLWKAVAAGKMSPERAAELFGMKIVGEIQKRISAGIPPPNAPSTVARKGSSTPLIDTGQLRSSITYVVHKT